MILLRLVSYRVPCVSDQNFLLTSHICQVTRELLWYTIQIRLQVASRIALDSVLVFVQRYKRGCRFSERFVFLCQKETISSRGPHSSSQVKDQLNVTCNTSP